MGASGGSKTTRHGKPVKVVIAEGAALSGVIDMRDFAAGGIVFPAAWTEAALGLYVCDTADGTFVPLYDADDALGTDVSIAAPAVNTARPLPVWAFAWPFVKLWSHTDGTNENQAAARTLTVVLKS